MPELIVYTGSMWSGKSQAMNGQLDLGRIAHIKVLLVRPTEDTREDRPGSKFSGETIIVADAMDVFDHEIENYEWIAFDEVQFFGENLIAVFKRLLRMGKRVLAAGLDLDYKEDPFVVVANAMALADHVYKLKSVCAQCRSLEGVRSQRLSDCEDVVQVGGEKEYEPRCFSCFVPPNGVVHSHSLHVTQPELDLFPS